MGGTSGAPGAGGVRSPCSWKWGLHSKVVAHGRSLRWAQGALQSLQGPNQAHGSVAARAQVSADPCLLGPSSAYWPPRHSSGLTGTTQRPSIFGASEHEPHRSPSGLFIEPQALVVSGALTPGGRLCTLRRSPTGDDSCGPRGLRCLFKAPVRAVHQWQPGFRSL